MACVCHIYLLNSIILFFYLFLNCIFKINLPGVFCLELSSRMTKFPPCTRMEILHEIFRANPNIEVDI